MRAQGRNTKIHYKGENEDFIIFVDSVDQVKKWKTDKSIPLTQVVDGFQVFVTGKQGAQGILDTASNSVLEAEFATSRTEDIIQRILESGKVEESLSREREGTTNLTMGSFVSHTGSRSSG